MKHTLALIMLAIGCAVAARMALKKRLPWWELIATSIALGVWLALASALAGCGGEAFTVGDAVARLDAGDVDAQPAMMSSPSEDDAGDGATQAARDSVDASAPEPRDVSSAPPATDGSAEPEEGQAPPAVDAGPPPPPPALCCMTPCQGSAVAPITCDNGPPWSCSAGSCSERACAVGATCTWMGSSCVGRVAVCP